VFLIVTSLQLAKVSFPFLSEYVDPEILHDYIVMIVSYNYEHYVIDHVFFYSGVTSLIVVKS